MAFEITSTIRWKIPPSTLVLLDQEIHIWQASLDQLPATLARFSETLSEDEQTRARRFHFERDREHYIAGRGILRQVLGQYLGLAPEKVEFVYGDHGKPALPGDSPLRFNLAHSNDRMLLAVTLRHEIGIDLEYLHLIPEADGIAKNYFTKAENKAMRSLPESQKLEGFFAHWVCKEAYLKALGDGLAKPLEAFEVLPTIRKPQGLLKVADQPEESKRWHFQVLRPMDGYIAALAVEQKDLKNVYWHWLDR